MLGIVQSTAVSCNRQFIPPDKNPFFKKHSCKENMRTIANTTPPMTTVFERLSVAAKFISRDGTTKWNLQKTDRSCYL
uniref:Uncharacterized protein n=1 Tax=Megaselia scalaris TaxID=36166 RepID=T1GIT4_MEGSC